MQCSRNTAKKKKKKLNPTPTVTHMATEKKEKPKKQDSNQCSPAAAPNLIPLFIAQCSLSVSLPRQSISFPLHLTPSLYSSAFPPPLPFITLMKKCQRVLWRYSEGAEECWQRRSSEMKRDRERRVERERQKIENITWCSPAMPTDKILVLCKKKKKKRLESHLKQRGHKRGCTQKFNNGSLSELKHALSLTSICTHTLLLLRVAFIKAHTGTLTDCTENILSFTNHIVPTRAAVVT